MANEFNASQCVTIDQDNRNMASPSSNVDSMSEILNNIYQLLALGTIGATSLGVDIDSACKGGGVFTIDPVNTTGLNFAWLAGRFHNGMAQISVAPGSLTLAANSTNYVELDRNGTLYTNTSAFTSGRMPLYEIVTGSSTIATTTYEKCLMTIIGPGGVTGAMLSSAAQKRSVQLPLGSISATAEFIFQSPVTGALSLAQFLTATGITANDTNYWSFSLVNKGAAGSGTQALLNVTGANSTTKATGGTALTAYVPDSFTLTTLTIGTELNVNAGDVLVFTATKTASATSMTECNARFDFTFTG